MRDGTYTGDFVCSLDGTTNNYITIRSYPNELPIIDGSFEIGFNSSGGIKFYVPRIINSTIYRGTDTDPFPANERITGINILSPNNLIIGGMVLDTGVSIGNWSIGSGTTVYGVLALNGGWVNDLRGHGHGIYTQNINGARTIKHCIFGPHFGRTIACYGSEDGENTGHRINENIIIDRWENSGSSQVLIGGQARNDDTQFNNNHVVGSLLAQYTYTQNGSVQIKDNIIWHRDTTDASFLVGYWEEPTVTGNIINGLSPIGDAVIKEMVRWTPPGTNTGTINIWDSNEYHYQGDEITPFKADDILKNYSDWKTATGFDASSTYDEVDTLPDAVYCYPNEYKDQYDKRCGIIVLWNGSSLDTVSIDISSMSLVSGSQYHLIQALDPLVDIDTFTYLSGTINVDMRVSEHTVAIPLGWDVALTDNTFPRFGAFLIEEA